MRISPRIRFSKRIQLNKSEISRFARAAGDSNPLHHDERFARQSKYGGIVASGPHTSALLMGLTADHFSRIGPMVGLEFSFRFRAPVPANQWLTLEWLVVRVTEHQRLGGQLVEMRGRLRTDAGVTAVGASGTVLVTTPN